MHVAIRHVSEAVFAQRGFVKTRAVGVDSQKFGMGQRSLRVGLYSV